MKYYWKIIADRLSKAGWSLGWVSAIDSQGRIIWIVDAHRGDGVQRALEQNVKIIGKIRIFEMRVSVYQHRLS